MDLIRQCVLSYIINTETKTTPYFRGRVKIGNADSLFVWMVEEDGKCVILVNCSNLDKNSNSKKCWYSLEEDGSVKSSNVAVEAIPKELVGHDLPQLYADLFLFLLDKTAAAERGILPIQSN